MKKFLQLLCLVMMAWMICSIGWAQTMGKQFEVSMALENYSNVTFPKNAILSGAKSAKIVITKCNYVCLSKRIDQWNATDLVERGWDNNKATAVFNINGDILSLAKSGELCVRVGGKSNDTQIFVTNYSTEDGAETGSGSGSNTETDNSGTTTEPDTNTDTDNPGTDTPVVTPSTKTLAEKIAAREQLTNLATVYMTVPDAEGKDINDVLFKDRTNNIADYHQTTIQVVENGCNDGTGRTLGNFTEAGLEIKVRGNSTAEMDKRPYRLRFFKDEKDAAGNVTVSHKHDMLGYGYEKRNWTILNNMRDGSLMQNAITYHIGQMLGMPFCPGYKFVDLVINNEYRGCYQLSDHVEVGNHRIEVDENTGWFVESTRHDMTEEPYFNDAALFVLIKSPESKTEAGTAEIKEMIKQYFVNNNNNIFGIWATGCDDKTFCDPKKGWRSVFDEETLVKFYIGTNLTGDYDGLMQVKMYREENGKMHFGPLWDKDLAFGVQGGTAVVEGEGTDYGAQEFSNYVKKIRNTDPLFMKKVHDKLHDMLDNGYVENLMAEIGKLENSLKESKALEYNNTGWKAVSVDGYPAAVERLRQYIKDHTKYFTDFIDEKYKEMHCDTVTTPTDDGTVDPGVVNPGTTEPAFEVDVPANMIFGSWDYKPIPSTLFNKKATSATISVKGAVFVCINKTNSETDAIVKFSWNDANKSGVTYEFEGENLELAKKGMLYIGCNPDESIKVTVTNHGVDDVVDNISPVETPTPAARAQLTNLPTIYLNAETIDGSWKQAAIEVFDKDNKLKQGVTWTKVGITTDGDPAIAVQFQGSGSMTSGKKESYRLKFGKKIALLTSDKYKQWVLLANDDDPSMLNNALAKELGDAVGMPWTPGYQYVDLYVNDTYMGTYQLTDRVKVEVGRSLVKGGNKDNDWHVQFNDDGEIKENDNSTYIAATETTPNIVIKNPDADDITAAQLATLKADMQDYFLNNFFVDIKNNVDREQLINWYICQEILCSYKGLSSIEVYRSITSTAADNKVHFGPLWDSEKAFGNAPKHPIDMSDKNTDGSHDGLITKYADYKVMKKILKALWKETWFKEGVIAKWKTLYGTEKTTDLLATLKSKAVEISGTLAESQAKNAELWPTSLDYATTERYSSYTEAVNHVKDYLDKRFAYLDVKFAELSRCSIIDLIRLIDNLNNDKQDADINDVEIIKNKILNN